MYVKNKLTVFLIGLFLLPISVSAHKVISREENNYNVNELIDIIVDENRFTNKIHSIDIHVDVL